MIGIAIFDRLEKELHAETRLMELMWTRRELENYFCSESVLLAYARYDLPNDLFAQAENERRVRVMGEAILEVAGALQTLGKGDPWSGGIKATDDFLDPVFRAFFKKLHLPLSLRKSDYHVLAGLVPVEHVDPEVVEKLDAIATVAEKARPRGG